MEFETVVSNFQPSRFPNIYGRPDYLNYLETPVSFVFAFFLI